MIASDASTQRKVGALLSYVGLVLNALANFIYVPLLLGFLTTQEYGVYELIGSIIAYLSVMDMGLCTTLNRYYVRIKITQGSRAVQNLLFMAAVVYGLLAALAVAAGFAFDWALDPLYGGSFTQSELALVHEMMRLVILNTVVVLPGNWFLALINANERFVFARAVSIGKCLLQIVAVLAVLTIKASAMAVLAVQVGVNLASVLLYVLYTGRVLGLRPKFDHWDWPLLASMLSFSSFILLNMVFDQVFWKTGQLVLGVVAGSSSVAVYGIACKVITAGYMQVSTGITGVFLPQLTAISARTSDMAEINELFVRIGRFQAIMVWGVLAAFCVMGADFIHLWAGPAFDDAYPAVVVLMLGLSVCLIQNLGISVLQAKNKMAFRAVVYILLAALDVVVSIPAAACFGVIGCAVVAAALLFVGTGPIMNTYYHKVIGIDVRAFFKSVLPLALPAVLSGVATAGVRVLLGWGVSWGGLMAEALVFMAVYGLLLWHVWANSYEKGLVRSLLMRVGIRRQAGE